MNPHAYEPAFCEAVLRKWRSNAVSSVLRARGVLQTGIASFQQETAEFDALKRADVAKHGLRDCALPSCSKTEKTVKEFAGCSGCRSVVYCCLEHQALDWRAHKKACREKEAARLAEEMGDGGDRWQSRRRLTWTSGGRRQNGDNERKLQINLQNSITNL